MTAIEPDGAGPEPVRATAHRSRSLRFRLLAATLAGLAVALLLAGFVLHDLFRAHVLRQFESGLAQQLDQLTARLEFDADGKPAIAQQSLSDPRWQRPYSGLYWQIDRLEPDGRQRTGVLRSRSLWDAHLRLPGGSMTDGKVRAHEGRGPQGARLLLLERTVRPPEGGASGWRLIVAADLKETNQAVNRFAMVLALSLTVLLALLSLAGWAQVAIGLQPLRALQQGLRDVRRGRSQSLQGAYPAEMQPLVDEFNNVLARNAEVVSRARTQAGNLAHALKTPLTVLDQAASRTLGTGDSDLARLVREQTALARRHIDWHLAQARMAATQRLPGQRTDVGAVAEGLMRVMRRIYAGRRIAIDASMAEGPLLFAGEEQDLQEMLGNLLDNACKWTGSRVTVSARLLTSGAAPRIAIQVADDGPGIEPWHMESVLARGVRLDETVPGSGLGLAIVRDIARMYGGELTLQPAAGAGLEAVLVLPAASSQPAA
ncbi:MAG: sensor histidine kinase [Noviherbaspirillum sp.]